nr:Type II secretion system (T2SS), protein G [uncultured bacterium]
MYDYYANPDTFSDAARFSDSSPTGNAEDAERKIDINSLQTQIEAYYAGNGNYPSLSQMNNASWRATNMKSLDSAALKDPQGSSQQLAAKPVDKSYSYFVTSNDGKSCEADALNCTTYTLTASLSDHTVYTKTNLD